MTTYTLTQPRRSWLGRAEDWLDSKGRGAWIAAMVLGFVVFWPIGLAFVAWITYTNRWSKSMFKMSGCNRNSDMARHGMNAMRSSGNSAFDAYKAETLRRLEDEQGAFEAFLQRLRDAKDKQEFDSFMDDRARAARTAPVEPTQGSGAY
jgi:hypothetical protein